MRKRVTTLADVNKTSAYFLRGSRSGVMIYGVALPKTPDSTSQAELISC